MIRSNHLISAMLYYIIARDRISYKQAQIIAKALKTNNSITSINLCNITNHIIDACNIETNGLKEILNALKINNSITSLNLSNIVFYIIGSNRFTMDDMKVFSEALKVNKSLRSINLGNILLY